MGEHAYEGAAARFATRLLKIVDRLQKTGKVFWKEQLLDLLSQDSSCKAAFIKHVGYNAFLVLLSKSETWILTGESPYPNLVQYADSLVKKTSRIASAADKKLLL